MAAGVDFTIDSAAQNVELYDYPEPIVTELEIAGRPGVQQILPPEYDSDTWELITLAEHDGVDVWALLETAEEPTEAQIDAARSHVEELSANV